MKTIVVTIEQAIALGNQTRWKMMMMLKKKELCIADFTKKIHYISPFPTTLRHHMLILENAGLVKISRMESERGSFTKYYKSTVNIK